MKTRVLCLAALAALVGGAQEASANLLLNGDLDKTYQQEIVPGFFLPKPKDWINDGSRTIGGPYEDEMSSEPWAGPAPTPVTTNGANSDDWAVFFKPFSGNATNGAATGHLHQTVAGVAGLEYTLTGWAGAEANASMVDARFAIEFLDSGNNMIGGVVRSILADILVPNGHPFNYKMFDVKGIAPVGTSFVRVRVSMIDAMANPAGGGQAYVVDDFGLTAVPEPATMVVLGLGALVAIRRRATK